MLMRFDPFRDLDLLSESLWGDKIRRTVSGMAIDAYKDGDRFVVHFDLPGVDPDSIDVTVEKDVLRVAAERSSTRDEGREWLARERYQGSFHRQLFLGEGLAADDIDAHYDRGVLTITIPVAETAKPRKVAVTTGAGTTAIDATSQPA